PWAAISPAWLTRIRPAAWRFSASVSGESGGREGLRVDCAGANRVRNASSAVFSTESSTSLANIGALYVMWLAKPPGSGPGGHRSGAAGPKLGSFAKLPVLE